MTNEKAKHTPLPLPCGVKEITPYNPDLPGVLPKWALFSYEEYDTTGKVGTGIVASSYTQFAYLSATSEVTDFIVLACNTHNDLLAALKEISEGAGPFSQDPLKHAANTIEAMKELARAAIAKATGK